MVLIKISSKNFEETLKRDFLHSEISSGERNIFPLDDDDDEVILNDDNDVDDVITTPRHNAMAQNKVEQKWGGGINLAKSLML